MSEVITGATIQIATGMHWGQIFVGGNPIPTLDYDTLAVKNVKVGGKNLAAKDPIRYDYKPGDSIILKTPAITDGRSYKTKNVS